MVSCSTKKGNVDIESDLLAPFKGDRCATLRGKPKVFLINSCRGHNKAQGLLQADDARANLSNLSELEADKPTFSPPDTDILVVYATMPGYVAWRQPTKGAWMMSALLDELQKRHNDEHLVDIITATNRRVAIKDKEGSGQVMQMIGQLTKKLYLRSLQPRKQSPAPMPKVAPPSNTADFNQFSQRRRPITG